MHKNAMVLQSRGSQHGLQGPIIEGNASRERLKSTDENISHNGVLVTTTLNLPTAAHQKVLAAAITPHLRINLIKSLGPQPPWSTRLRVNPINN
ncbi:MAG: hypothetical protein L6R42_006766 [Xanthoria sp. 1 TBL-2021]|nr:MAG: hypothetical protein L6R42_006766 [Xanthoria sp. 1 TBL-2021]